MRDNLSQEDRLICLCCRLNFSPEEERLIRGALSRPLDWSYIIKELKEHKVATLFFHTLSEFNLDSGNFVPAEALSKLRQTYYSVAEQNLRHYQGLKELVAFLNDRGAEAIFLKGMILAELVYKNLALRQMVDADLLVKRQDLRMVKSFLLEFGYKQGYQDTAWSKYLESFGGEMYLFKDGFPSLDVHTSICQYERFKGIIKIDDNAMWQRTQKLYLDNVAVSALSPEDMVLQLCLHLSVSHFFHKLSLFCDLRETVIYYGKAFDWQAFIQRAKDYRMRRLVYESLSLTADLMGSFIGKGALEELKPGKIKTALLNLTLAGKVSSLNALKDERRKYIFQLLSLDSSLNIFRLAFKVFFPSAEWLRYRYAIKTAWKYYLFRLLHPCLAFRAFLLGRMKLRH